MTLTTPTMNNIYFSKLLVTKQVFYKSKYTYALVNLKPLVPGHVLIVPLNTNILNISDLSPKESTDYFRTLQIIHRFIKWYYKADSLNIAIQDGPEAGQSIPHLHTHIIPRYKLNNIGDKIYDKLDAWNARRECYVNADGRNGRKKHGIVENYDSPRVPRSEEEMYKEALELGNSLESFLEEHPELNDY
ncbi:related to Bis(5'-adenosyl)-triphosphatase [Saccharomycodes ludwigii]|uniref:Bis(5'-adenosyl)-triphosphatase n=2 Tax=Saccharomycodes ludwigii TaxID=36035 RepID=A0A376B745_9ASCO|nr:related to Bis(5'-adenosyl)-triphosphatase [Saccharomycodes ludwigii]